MQDEEYTRTLEEDRKLISRREEELRAKEQAEEDAKENEELEFAVQLSKDLEKENRMSRIKAALPAEPVNGPDVVNIKFQLPSGKKIARNFLKENIVRDLRYFLILYFNDNQIELPNFSLSTNYPKRVLDNDLETVVNAGLFPRGMLFVQNLDA